MPTPTIKKGDLLRMSRSESVAATLRYDLPAWQPCPVCRRRSRRETRASGGGDYRCPNHGSFFVNRG